MLVGVLPVIGYSKGGQLLLNFLLVNGNGRLPSMIVNR